MTYMPDYSLEVSAGDIVRPIGGGVFARALGQPKTATVLGVRVYNCPMEGPEWLVETTAGDYFSRALERALIAQEADQ